MTSERLSEPSAIAAWNNEQLSIARYGAKLERALTPQWPFSFVTT
jgi:hypothetical protein